MFHIDDMAINLFDQIINACKKMLTSFMIPRELLGECDEGFVIHVERSLGITKFVQEFTKIDYVLCCLASGVEFGLCRAERYCCLLVALGVEGA